VEMDWDSRGLVGALGSENQIEDSKARNGDFEWYSFFLIVILSVIIPD